MKDTSAPEIPWQTQAAIYGAGLFSFTMVLISSLIVTLLAVQLTKSEFLIGLIVGSRYFLTLALSIHGGALMDRLGTRRVMIAFALVAVVAPLLFPLALLLPFGAAIISIILLQMLAGVSDAMVWVGAQALSGHIMKGHRLYVGRMTAIVRLGAFFGPIIFGYIWDQTSVTTTFVLMALWSALGFWCVLKIPSTSQEEITPKNTKLNLSDIIPRMSDYIAAFRLIAIPAVALILLVTMVRIGGTGIQSSFYVVFLRDIEISAAIIGVLIGIAQLLASVGSLSASSIARMIHPHWLVIYAVFMTVITIAITPVLVFGASMWITLLLLATIIGVRGLCLGISQPMEISVLGQAVATTEQGVGAGLRTTVNRLASSVVPPLMGAVAELVGIRNSFFIMGALLLIILGFSALFVKRNRDLGRDGSG
ncbi:MAG: MFS transporter [Alphaproteobacteria bacterium]|mgnify:FL=1